MYPSIWLSLCIYLIMLKPIYLFVSIHLSLPHIAIQLYDYVHSYLSHIYLLVAIGVVFCSVFMHVGFSVNVMSVIISLFGKKCDTIVMIIIHTYIHMSLAHALLYIIISKVIAIHHLHIIHS